MLAVPCDVINSLDNWRGLLTVAGTSKLNIIHLNVRSLQRHWGEINVILDQHLNKIDLIVFTETHLKLETVDFYNFDNFEKYSYCRPDQRGGGIIIYVRRSLCAAQLRYDSEAFENVTVKIKICNKLYRVCAVYRPPDRSKQQFVDELDIFLQHTQNNEGVVCIGDFNVNFNNAVDSVSLLDMMASHGMANCVTGVTREEIRDGVVTRSCIDLIFVRHASLGSTSAIIQYKISDHYMTALHLRLGGDIEQSRNTKIVINERKLTQKLNETNWDDVLELNDADSIYQAMCRKFNSLYSDCSMSVPSTKRTVQPWITQDLLDDIKERDRLFRLHKHSPRHPVHCANYKKMRNRVNKKIKICKNEYVKNDILSVRNNAQQFWNKINNILGRKKQSVDETVERYFLAEGVSKNEIISNFENYFLDSVAQLNHQCNTQLMIRLPQDGVSDRSMYCGKATEQQVKQIVTTLKNKGPGIDGIRTKDLKHCADKLSPIITKLINLTLQTGLIPHTLKTAVYRPIYKGGSHSEYRNYRPVAQLNQVHKVMEAFMSQRLSYYLHQNEIIAKNQYAYQKTKSTNTLLTDFSQLIFKCLNDRRQALVLFIDYSKAFDILDHNLLVQRLADIGVPQKLQDWFKNYVNRSVCVKLWGEVSGGRQVATGVPQGSILGPTLFLVYTNTLNYLLNVDNTSTFSYADDVAIVVTHESLSEAEKIMQSNLNKILVWSHDMGLVINSLKTKVIHIRSPQFPTRPINLVTHTQQCMHTNLPFDLPCTCSSLIETVSEFKYLGVTLDSRFKFDVHIDYLNKKLRSFSYIMFQLRTCLTFPTLRSMYCTFIESIIRYGLLTWGNTTRTYLDIIQTQQKRILKAILNNKTDTRQDNFSYFKHFNVLPVDKLHTYVLILLFFKNNKYREVQWHGHGTRGEGRYIEKRYNNEYGRQLWEHTVPATFNRMPDNIEQAESVSKFKNQVKLWLLGVD